MIKLIFLALFLGALNTSIYAQINPQKDSIHSSLLWKIYGNKLNKPSYLYGSMHLIERQYYHFSDTLKNYILSVQQLVMELNEAPNQLAVLNKLKLPEGQTLDAYFRPGQLDSLLTYMEQELSIPRTTYEMMLNKMKPFVLLQLLMSKSFSDKTESYDLSIMKLANDNEIPIIGLETIDQQIGFFDSIPTQVFINNIVKAIKDSVYSSASSDEMQKIYAGRNLDSLAAYMQKEGDALMEDYKNLFIDQRNKNWTKQLLLLLKKKTTFIAVGAAHLIGENGLIQLLRAQGYTLTPIAY
jgi:uncharacterized protein YbaP (TraB family)